MVKKPIKTKHTATRSRKTATKKTARPTAKQSVSRASAAPRRQVEAKPLRTPSANKPTVILIGADKGGVGKTTIARAMLDFLALNDINARAFDTESPRGTLHRFHPDNTSIINLASTSDQMKVIDTLTTSKSKVNVIDVRAGGLSRALAALDEIGFFDAVKSGEFRFILLHVVGPSIASLDEIASIAPYVEESNYFIVKNHVNDTTFFEWDPQTHEKYFEDVTMTGEITIPRLGELAYEQVELAGTSFSSFIQNLNADSDTAQHSFVLRGYTRTWLARVADEFEQAGLLDLIGAKTT